MRFISDRKELETMTKHFEIVEREGGWAIKTGSRYSTVFATRHDALTAAKAEFEDSPEDDNVDDLTEGLEETFPASDPVSATGTTTAGKPGN